MPDFLYPVPSSPPDENRDWIVAFNPLWLPILIDAVDNLLNDDLFVGMPPDASEQVDQLILMLTTPYDCEVIVSTAKRSVMLHQDSIVLNGNSIDFILNTAQMFNGHWRQETAALNDEWTNGFDAAAGNYTLRFVVVRGASSGVMDVYVDGDYIAQIDFYNAGGQNHIVVDLSITLAADGYHVLRGKVVGKSGSSTGYRAGIISMSVLSDTAD